MAGKWVRAPDAADFLGRQLPSFWFVIIDIAMSVFIHPDGITGVFVTRGAPTKASCFCVRQQLGTAYFSLDGLSVDPQPYAEDLISS